MTIVQIDYTSEPAPAGRNEDCFRAGSSWAVVIDGAGRYPGRDAGCVHPVTWVVEHLADHLADHLARSGNLSLSDLVAESIRATMTDHGSSCDLTDPLSPGAAVAVLRTHARRVKWLVLGDCAVVLEGVDGRHTVVIDDRVDRLPDAPVVDTEVRTYDPDYVATVRNQPGGFWVAGAVPHAAYEALLGDMPSEEVSRVLLCSDGVTRLVERHGWTWQQMFATADSEGPQALVDAVRKADADSDARHWRGKLHDDATVALLRLISDQRG